MSSRTTVSVSVSASASITGWRASCGMDGSPVGHFAPFVLCFGFRASLVFNRWSLFSSFAIARSTDVMTSGPWDLQRT